MESNETDKKLEELAIKIAEESGALTTSIKSFNEDFAWELKVTRKKMPE